MLQVITFCVVCTIMSISWGATGETIRLFAQKLDKKASALGIIYLGSGVGGLIGSLIAGPIFDRVPSHVGMLIFQFLMAGSLFAMPFVQTVPQYTFLNGLFGISFSGLDTGCQLLSTWLHGSKAGPYLIANVMHWALGTAATPVLFHFITGLSWKYYILSMLCGVCMLMVGCFIRVEKPVVLKQEDAGKRLQKGRPLVLVLMSFCLFLSTGCVSALTAWIKLYAIDEHDTSKTVSSYMQSLLWISITGGRLVAVGVSAAGCSPKRMLILNAIAASFSMLPTLWAPHIADRLFVSIALFGFFAGPCVGYSYDVSNKSTYATGNGYVVQMVGLNLGVNGLGWIAGLVFEHSAADLMWMMFWVMATILVPLGVLELAQMAGVVSEWKEKIPSADYVKVDCFEDNLRKDRQLQNPV